MKNRQLKFRVWNHADKKWIHGPGEEVNLFGECILLGGFMPVSLEKLNDCVALQFTGLKDLKNQEIYENDIVKFHCFGFDGNETDNNLIGYIKYDDQLCSFVIETKHNRCFYVGDTTHFEEPCIEILGNIFENPELLKK